MNPKELRDIAYYARRYINELAWNSHDYVAERQYALICCDYVLDTVKEDDDDRLTAKSVLAHPDYEKQEFVEHGEADFSYWIGEVEFVWYSDDEFTVKMFDAELYPQPTTWGELRYLAKMLNAKLESS